MNDSNGSIYAFGGFRLHPRRRVLLHADGHEVELTAKAFDALLYLVEHAGTVVTRASLTEALWPRTIVEDHNLNKLIMVLRRALGEGREQRYIATLQGRGYQFVADVRTVDRPLDGPFPDRAHVPTDPHLALPATNHGPVWFSMRKFSAALVVAIATGLFLTYLYSGGSSSGEAAESRLGTVVETSNVTTYPGEELSPSLSPDGEEIVFSWDGADRNRDVYVTEIDGSSPRRLTDAPEPDRDPAWSPDGRHIAFLRQRGVDRFDVFTIPARVGPERLLAEATVGGPREISGIAAPFVAWTPDSQHLLFTSRLDEGTYALHVMSLDGGTPSPLFATKGVNDTSPAMSPDARWLAFTRFVLPEDVGTLLVQRLGADFAAIGEPIVVPNEAGLSTPHSPAWSADSRYLTFVTGSRLMEWQVGSDASRIVHVSNAFGGFTAQGDQSALSLVRRGESVRAVAASITRGLDIWAIPLAPDTYSVTGPAEPRASSTQNDMAPRFSPDAQRLAFVSSRGGGRQIWITAADGSDARPLTNLDRDRWPDYPRWSPDGGEIAFNVPLSGGSYEVYVVDVDTGVARPWSAAGCCPEWSADGDYLYLSEAKENGQVIRVRAADGHREALFRGDWAVETVDGRLLYGKIGEFGLFARALAGNPAENPEERLVDDYTPPLGGIVPVDDGFFYLGFTPERIPRAFRFYDYARREARDIAEAPASTAWGLTISKDRRELLYTSADPRSGADLVRFEIELYRR